MIEKDYHHDFLKGASRFSPRFSLSRIVGLAYQNTAEILGYLPEDDAYAVKSQPEIVDEHA